MMYKLFYTILFAKYLIHIVVYYKYRNALIRDEMDMYADKWNCPYGGVLKLIWLLENFPEYRNVFYHRTNSKLLSKIYKGQHALYIQVSSDKLGEKFMIWHGFSTIINAERIGNNCSIWQQVTIGNKLDKEGKKPVIGNNVKICAGSIIIGDVTIGDNVIIGAGAVVTKDVPANSVAVGVPAKCLNRGL